MADPQRAEKSPEWGSRRWRNHRVKPSGRQPPEPIGEAHDDVIRRSNVMFFETAARSGHLTPGEPHPPARPGARPGTAEQRAALPTSCGRIPDSQQASTPVTTPVTAPNPAPTAAVVMCLDRRSGYAGAMRAPPQPQRRHRRWVAGRQPPPPRHLARLLIHHTDCGMPDTTFVEKSARIANPPELGNPPESGMEAFHFLDTEAKQPATAHLAIPPRPWTARAASLAGRPEA